MIMRAPAMRAPWIAARPTPPAPKTATVDPGSTRAVLRAAPRPVVTLQPMRAARESAISSPIFTRAFSVEQHLLGVAGDVRELLYRLAFLGKPRWLSLGTHRAVGAAVGVTGEALLALAAEDGQARDHAVAGLDVAHVRPHRLHDARGLMAEHRGKLGQRIGAIDEVEVAVTDAAGDGAHQHLAPDRLVDVDLLDDERLVGPVKECCFHPCVPGRGACRGMIATPRPLVVSQRIL